PPSRKAGASPTPQKPSASSQVSALNVNPSYSSATSTSDCVSDVRLHRCAAGPKMLVRWVMVPWSHDWRSSTFVPTASTSTGVCRRSLAVSTADTTTATAPSHGTSQSYSPNGVLII